VLDSNEDPETQEKGKKCLSDLNTPHRPWWDKLKKVRKNLVHGNISFMQVVKAA